MSERRHQYPIDSPEGQLLADALVSQLDFQHYMAGAKNYSRRLNDDVRAALDYGIAAEIIARTLSTSPERVREMARSSAVHARFERETR